jgi:hypothetical protein
MATYSNAYYRNRYSTNVNGQMMRNPRYNKGWETGQSYCSYYVSTYLGNPEFTKSDLRASDKWFTVAGDGFFNYTGASTFDDGSRDSQWFTLGGL